MITVISGTLGGQEYPAQTDAHIVGGRPGGHDRPWRAAWEGHIAQPLRPIQIEPYLRELTLLPTLHLEWIPSRTTTAVLLQTYTGTILVAINPYQVLPIYTADQINEYRDQKIGDKPPHIFAVADNAYHSMKRYGQDQCVVIRFVTDIVMWHSSSLMLVA